MSSYPSPQEIFKLTKAGKFQATTAELAGPQVEEVRYQDADYEYRHVLLPSDIAAMLPKGELLSESAWRSLGVQQSRGWIHYAIHRPEPHIMLFKRPLNYQANMQPPVQHQQAAGQAIPAK